MSEKNNLFPRPENNCSSSDDKNRNTTLIKSPIAMNPNTYVWGQDVWMLLDLGNIKVPIRIVTPVTIVRKIAILM